MLWAGIETRSKRLRLSACLIFALAFLKLLLWDTPYGYRQHSYQSSTVTFFHLSLSLVACLEPPLSIKPGETKEDIGPGLEVCFLA
jgi:hypothetical protein